VFPNTTFLCILKRWSIDSIIETITYSNSLFTSILVTFHTNYQKDFQSAYDLFSDQKKEQTSYAKFSEGYSATLSHVVDEIKCLNSECTFDVIAAEKTDVDVRRTKYTFRYQLVRDNQGSVKIDATSYLNQELVDVLQSTKVSGGSIKDSDLISVTVRIECDSDYFGYVNIGSGTVISKTGLVLSNFHVKGEGYHDCKVNLPSKDGRSFGRDYSVIETVAENSFYDYWFFKIGINSGDILPVMNLPVCVERDVNIGDAVRIYGYPGAGGDSITVTEGLLSSFDQYNEAYVTSAKIDHGNSGGMAVDVTESCFLGIPTWADKDQFESYGRIIKASKIKEDYPNLFAK